MSFMQQQQAADTIMYLVRFHLSRNACETDSLVKTLYYQHPQLFSQYMEMYVILFNAREQGAVILS